MNDTRLAVEITIDISDLTQDDIDQIQQRIEDATGPWKPLITITPREY
ncbi:hypothetical protein [Streptomyces capoamus]